MLYVLTQRGSFNLSDTTKTRIYVDRHQTTGINTTIPNTSYALVMTYNIFPLYIQILHQIRSQMVEVNMSQQPTIVNALHETSSFITQSFPGEILTTD